MVELPAAERRAAGIALRQLTPRRSHAWWTASRDRHDPIATILAQGATRLPELLPIRHRRMAASPLAFLRGAAAVMAADLATTPVTGPRVQSCGDCHLFNFGSYASPEGRPVFDINDFDETLPAPFEWDVKRLATSLFLAGRESGLEQAGCRRLARRAARAYRTEIGELSALSPLDAWSVRIDLDDAISRIGPKHARAAAARRLRAVLRSGRSQFGLVDDEGGTLRLRDKPPLMFRVPAYDAVIDQAFAAYVAASPPERLVLLERYRLRDVSFKVVGIGSVGTFCAVGLFASPEASPLLLQLKEAQGSVLAPFAGASAFGPAREGERVVVGQRVMQAQSDVFLGWTPASGDGRQFYVRRLKDSRLASVATEIEQEALPAYATLCGRTLGRAHVRSGDASLLAGYLGRGHGFERAVAGFAMLYAEQVTADWRGFRAGIATGAVPAAAA